MSIQKNMRMTFTLFNGPPQGKQTININDDDSRCVFIFFHSLLTIYMYISFGNEL